MRTSTGDMWRRRLQDPLPGGLATLVLPTMVGKLVYFRKFCKTLDRSAVFPFVDVDHFSTEGAPAGAPAEAPAGAPAGAPAARS